MIVKYRSQFKQQKNYFQQNAKLKAELTKNEYKKKYGEIEFDFDFEKVDFD